MIRFILVALLTLSVVWAPWMDGTKTEETVTRSLEAFGPVPSACYDSNGTLLQDGLALRWYPMGRLVHTCAGDYVVWFWGATKELGGVYKRAEDIRPIQSRPLSCREVLDRREARRATSTDDMLVVFTGEPASEPDFSIFPEAEEYRTILTRALTDGPNFAGTFAVVEWSCGTTCQNHAIIEVEEGLVVGMGPQTEYGVQYSLDSTLLVTNPASNLPEPPDSLYETESLALDIARLPREYYRLTTDVLSGTQYLVRECVESSITGYIDIEDDRLGVIEAYQ